VEKTMKIAVVGCGAMGSVYAGLLGSAGSELDDLLIEARFRQGQGIERGQLLRAITEACDATQRQKLVDAIATAFGPDGIPPSRRDELRSLARSLRLET